MIRLTTNDKVIILCVLLSGIVSYVVTDFINYQQTSFDKQGAAEQFYIEINSLEPLIQRYASFYFSNYDLSYNDNKTPGYKNISINPNIYTILKISSDNYERIQSPYLLTLYNNTYDRGYLLNNPPIGNETGLIQVVDVNITDDNGSLLPSEVIDCYLSNPIIPSQLYNDNGMFYVYVKDIPKFDPILAQNLDSFYYEVTTAEADRNYLENHLSAQNETHTNGYNEEDQYFNVYMDMRVNIMKASELLPVIINELNEEISNT